MDAIHRKKGLRRQLDMTNSIKLNRVAKGLRPQFSQEPEIDRVLAITMSLASEVSVLADKLDTLTTVLEKKGVLKQDEISTYALTEIEEELRSQRREEFLDRILYIIKAEAYNANPAIK